MTHDQAKVIVAAVVAHYPGTSLTDAQINAYASSLTRLERKPALAAALEVAKREERFPSVAGLLRAIGELLAGAPSPEDAWEEVRASFSEHTCYPTRCDYGDWTPSHPVIDRTVKAMGYHALLHGTNPSADRAQFTRHYLEFRKQTARRIVAGELAPTPAAGELGAAGKAPVVPATTRTIGPGEPA